ncbi:MAG: HXXEE domain-containing protein [Bacteroidota bacterium]|nr:HXXEE domain-containing protein [Bacteroidota bacterium]
MPAISTTKEISGYIILLAPLIFICHFIEEAPGFVSWFNHHVNSGINYRLFWSVNIFALVITIAVVVIEFISPSPFSAFLVVLWFSFLMLANALFHITGAITDKAYMPGLITAVILYLPYYFFMMGNILKSRRMKIFPITGVALLGSLPMLIHGYMILFLRDRLF